MPLVKSHVASLLPMSVTDVEAAENVDATLPPRPAVERPPVPPAHVFLKTTKI